MNRLSLPVWLLVIVIAGFCMFQVKFAVQELEGRLATTNRQILQAEDALRVLKAEWSYLNEPERLSDLNRRHLGLAPVSARQMVGLADLPVRQAQPNGAPEVAQRPLPDGAIAPASAEAPMSAGPSAEDTAALAKLLSAIEAPQ